MYIAIVSRQKKASCWSILYSAAFWQDFVLWFKEFENFFCLFVSQNSLTKWLVSPKSKLEMVFSNFFCMFLNLFTSAIGRGGGVKNWSKLPTDSAKKQEKNTGGVTNPEKLLTSFMDGPLNNLEFSEFKFPKYSLNKSLIRKFIHQWVSLLEIFW